MFIFIQSIGRFYRSATTYILSMFELRVPRYEACQSRSSPRALAVSLRTRPRDEIETGTRLDAPDPPEPSVPTKTKISF